MNLHCAPATAVFLLCALPNLAVAQAKPPDPFDECFAASMRGEASPEARYKVLMDCMSSKKKSLQKKSTWQPPPASKRGARTWLVDQVSLSVNSAGQVEPRLVYVNPESSSAIKYVTVVLRFYNAVGDLLRSDIGNEVGAKLQFTGPLRATDQPKTVKWDSGFYSSTATCAQVQSLTVEFMDGRSAVFEGASLREVLNPKIKNDCGVRVR
jgi:hypothetical protein